MTSQLITPVGRIVWGNPLVGRDKEKDRVKVKKDGVQVKEYTFGLAIPKGEFGAIDPVSGLSLATAMQMEAQAVCPQGVPADFSFKMKDGDKDLDKNGQPLSLKPGYAGHFVLAISTEFPIPVFKRNGAGFEAMTDGVKTGDYARAQITINGHGRAPGVTGSKPGLYLNPNQVEFVGFGQLIASGADPSAFGAAPALPAGASATPTAPANAPFPGQQAAPPQQPATPAAPPAPNAGFPWGTPG